MIVRFVKNSQRQYAVVVITNDGTELRMNPAPGYDDDMPHDMQHFIVEAELGLKEAMYGQLAKCGNAGTLSSAEVQKDRAGARKRSKQWRETPVGEYLELESTLINVIL